MAKDVRWTHAILLYHWLGNTEPLSKQGSYAQKSQELLEGLKQVKKYRSSEQNMC